MNFQLTLAIKEIVNPTESTLINPLLGVYYASSDGRSLPIPSMATQAHEQSVIMDISGVSSVNGRKLTYEEQMELQKLKIVDQQVRVHEAAHLAAAGSMANGVQYDYVTGPDGKLYAVGGEVNVTTESGGSPEEALAKARQLRAAASAPDDPSGQDESVIAKASAMEAEAQSKISEQRATHQSQPRRPFGSFETTA